MELIQSWLSDCSANHATNCASNIASVLPTRLVDVGLATHHSTPAVVRLINTTPGQRGAYTALSYCWGSNGAGLKLTTANKRILEDKIQVVELSATVRQAVDVTRRLGIRYLWVDCLCIIQGQSEEALADWERESGRMCDVYGGARLTIAASAADSAEKGLFSPRLYGEEGLVHGVQLVPEAKELGEGKEEKAASNSNNKNNIVSLWHRLLDSTHEPRPLNTRGWAWQEAQLSARIVSFGWLGVSWLCPSGTRYEWQIERGPPIAVPRGIADKKQQARDFLNMWEMDIGAYTNCDFTVLSDRLPAVSGIADLIVRELEGVTYHYGLFRVPVHLMWRHRGSSFEWKVYSGRQKTWRAPTWSWTSVDTAVGFPAFGFEVSEELSVLKFVDKRLFLKGCLEHVSFARCRVMGAGGRDHWNHFTPEEDVEEGSGGDGDGGNLSTPTQVLPTRKKGRFPKDLRFYIDAPDEEPVQQHMRHSRGEAFEFRDIWFFFVGKDCGLILVRVKPPLSDADGSVVVDDDDDPDGLCTRIGVFFGYGGCERFYKLRQRVQVE